MKAIKIGATLIGISLILTWFVGPPIMEKISYAMSKGENKAGREELVTLSKTDAMSPLFVQIAKVVSPSVVEVRVTKKIKMQQPDVDQFFQHFFGGNNQFGSPQGQSRPQPREYIQRGLGSGVIVNAEKGYVLTNNHVVSGADETQVVLHNGRILKTEWIRTDPMTDLAVVKVPPSDLIEAPLGDSDAMQVGDWVLAISTPRACRKR